VSNNNIQKVREGKTLGRALRMQMYSVRILCFPINTPGLMEFECWVVIMGVRVTGQHRCYV
jgi:hypothetical protein